MKEKKLTRLRVLRVMSYNLLHFLIREKILSVFLTECLNNDYSWILKSRIIEQEVFQISIISHDMYEFENYFRFGVSTTLTESVWWRYAFKYREEYSWKV
nr:MAG: hypothetical protein [Bacteriophage sp.]